MTGSIARSQPRGQQTSAVTLEDEHGVVHMLVVGAVEDAELLLAMRGIVGGVDIQQGLAALANLLAAQANELIEQGVVSSAPSLGRKVHSPNGSVWAGSRALLPASDRRRSVKPGPDADGHHRWHLRSQRRSGRCVAATAPANHGVPVCSLANHGGVWPSRGSDDGVRQKPATATDRHRW